MIVADSPALVTAVLGEPESSPFVELLDRDEVAISATTLTASRIVVERRQGIEATHELDLVIRHVIDNVIAHDEQRAVAAHAAWRRFGKGRHPAALNFGDCMVHATAQLAGAALLFKGDDFAQTDRRPALA